MLDGVIPFSLLEAAKYVTALRFNHQSIDMPKPCEQSLGIIFPSLSLPRSEVETPRRHIMLFFLFC